MTNTNNIPINSIGGGGYEIKLTRQVSTEQLCNRNELINADFRQGRLVNQRGITEKTGNGYTVDMWYISTGNPNQCGVRVEENGIVLYKHQDNVFFDFATLIEDGSKLCDQSCTISVLAKCSTLGVLISTVHQGTGTVILSKVITGDSTKFDIYAYTFQVPTLAFGDYLKISFRHRQSTSKDEQPKIQKAMLEYGDTSTLHNWHGDYAAELRKCQYYLERLGNNFSESLTPWVYVPDGQTYALFPIYYSRKRIIPTIMFNEGAYRLLIANAQTGDIVTATADFNIVMHEVATENMTTIKVTFGALGIDAYVKLQRFDGTQSAFMLVSAEL